MSWPQPAPAPAQTWFSPAECTLASAENAHARKPPSWLLWEGGPGVDVAAPKNSSDGVKYGKRNPSRARSVGAASDASFETAAPGASSNSSSALRAAAGTRTAKASSNRLTYLPATVMFLPPLETTQRAPRPRTTEEVERGPRISERRERSDKRCSVLLA